MALKYKIGDKVRIKSLDWYNENTDSVNKIVRCGAEVFMPEMSQYCGQIATIAAKFKNDYCLNIDNGHWSWTDEMIEGLVEEENVLNKWTGLKVELELSKSVIGVSNVESLRGERFMSGFVKAIIPPDGYQFTDENGNVIKATKIVLEKKTDKTMNENNTKVDMGEVSDGYHTFNELYEYRMLYNAALFNEFAKQGLYDVHKSRKHSDGEYPFGDSNWFIVMAELPTGQISNHYEMKDWNKFQIPEKSLANKWDKHSPRDVADRLTDFTNPKKKYPKTYDECYKIIVEITGGDCNPKGVMGYKARILESLQKLLVCRDVYWKIAGEEVGLGKPWEPDWTNNNEVKFIIGVSENEFIKGYNGIAQYILAFPTEEMRDAFYENFGKDIEFCKELL